jgi:type IV secretion system protein VirB10
MGTSLDLNPVRPGVKRLSPRMITGLGCLGVFILTIAFAYGFGGRSRGGTAQQPAPAFTPASENVIDTALTRLPEDYRFDVQDYLRDTTYDSPPETPEGSKASGETKSAPDPTAAAALETRQRQLERLRKQLEEAMDSPLVFGGVETRRNESAGVNPHVVSHDQQASLGQTDSTRVALTDDGFLARSQNNAGKRLVESPSPYEIKAGTILPGALLTGIHSDLPGVMTGQVTEHVYDSVSGSHLLIPQGSRLIGRYSSLVGTGQNRVLIAWDRIILPNGDSMDMPTLPGVDALGRSGLADRVDYHVGRVGLATVLSTAIAYVGNIGRDTDSENDVVGETIAQQASQLGQRIIDRELDLPPTVTVRPGTRFNVLVNEDLILKPYTLPGE